ncbi:MAG: hypothetical protein RML56_14830 [Burkholderiales bacterium]|nr:hypothetical protein [Burkholderiales bacterium]
MGLGLGFVYDQSKWNANFDAANSGTDIKRRSWAIPVTYETGNHGLYATYGRARDWRGSLGAVSRPLEQRWQAARTQ